jgi:hypothetical protein
MQPEDHVNKKSNALSDHASNQSVRESKVLNPTAHVLCFTPYDDSNQRKLHRNPGLDCLTRSEVRPERENSGFSV